jgi:hypothetical protein
MATGARFDFYEKVIVASADPSKAEITGRLGAVLGRVCDDNGRWSYAIGLYDGGACWFCWEDELRPTGEFDRRESFYDGSSIRVSQHGELLD